MELSINDLALVWEAIYEVRTQAYDIGLMLKIRVDTLDSIEGQCKDSSEKLREVLKAWLKTAAKPTWQGILGALKSRVIGQPNLASEIEAKHCTKAEIEQGSGQTKPEVQLPQQPATRDKQLRTLQIKGHQLQRQIQQLTHQVDEKQHTIDAKEEQVQQLTRQLEKGTGGLKRQLQEAQQQVKEKQHALDVSDGQLQELNQQLQALKQVKAQSEQLPMQQKTIQSLRWQKESKAPEKMRRGSTASDSNMAYFNGYDSTTVYSYDSGTQKWNQLPDTPHTSSTLVVVQDMLTMVGGCLRREATNLLLSLMGEGRKKNWVRKFPVMPTRRYNTAAVYSGHSLIVAGGNAGSNRLDTVEMLDTDTRQWLTACSLPHPFSDAAISICGHTLYVLGGLHHGYGARSVFSCSVLELLQSCQTQPLARKLRTAPVNQSTIWQHVPDVPHCWSSCATFCEQLVAVGGMDKANKDTTAILAYDEKTDSWKAVGDMPTARCSALIAILNGKMMVVGGYIGGSHGGYGYWTKTDVVETLY